MFRGLGSRVEGFGFQVETGVKGFRCRVKDLGDQLGRD